MLMWESQNKVTRLVFTLLASGGLQALYVFYRLTDLTDISFHKWDFQCCSLRGLGCIDDWYSVVSVGGELDFIYLF